MRHCVFACLHNRDHEPFGKALVMAMRSRCNNHVTQSLYTTRRGSSLIAPSLLLAVRVLEHDFSNERLMEILETFKLCYHNAGLKTSWSKVSTCKA